MCRRPDGVCKLECINKFSVLVSYHADHFIKSYATLTKVWVESMDS